MLQMCYLGRTKIVFEGLGGGEGGECQGKWAIVCDKNFIARGQTVINGKRVRSPTKMTEFLY